MGHYDLLLFDIVLNLPRAVILKKN